VPPLPTPGEGENLQQLLACKSVQLFVDRAQAGSPEFALTEGNAGAVAALCRRLEGLPLALALAAARAGVLTAEQILSQLERGLGVLSSRLEGRDATGRRALDGGGGGRPADFPPSSADPGAAARHRSLRTAFEWSYQLLEPNLQRFFRGLSVYQGGWSLESAEAVSGEELSLEFLEQLRECSLIRAEEVSAPSALCTPHSALPEMRFRLLETLREYGREQLGEEERERLEQRHAQHFMDWAEQASEELRQGREQPVWLERLRLEHDNLRAALAWAVGRREAEIALRLAVALAPFWERRGYFSEGRERLAAILLLPDVNESVESTHAPLRSLRARALVHAGALAWRQGDYEPARTLLGESLALQRTLDNSRGVAIALSMLGAVAFSQGEFDASRDFGTQALAIFRELGPPRSIAVELHNLANVARAQSDYESAKPLYAESLALSRQLDDRYDVAYCLHGLGLVAHCQGEWERARGYYDECLAIRRALGDQAGMSMALYTLGLLARDQGDYGRAGDCFEESLALRRELGGKRGIALSLYGQGTLAGQQGDEAMARSLLEESLARFREGGDRHMAASASADLGALLSRRGEYDAARPLLEASLAIYREIGDRRGIGTVLSYLGSMALDQGDEEAAGRDYRESLASFRQVGERYRIVRALEGLAWVAATCGDAPRSARLCAAAAALREVLGAPVAPADRADYERRVAAVRASLGEPGFAAAWAEGSRSDGSARLERCKGSRRSAPTPDRALSLDEAITLALEDAVDRAGTLSASGRDACGNR
jgi:predicted ATPase